jgi:GNAT superfamily N-acetyltransferase
MEKELDLRPLDFENLSTAIDIAVKIFGEEDRIGIEEEFRASLGILPERDIVTKEYNIRDLSFFLLYKDGCPAGVTGYYNLHGHEEDAWLDWIGVLPEYRGGGVGMRIANESFRIAAERFDVRNFRIWTTNQPLFDAARACYHKMGFTEELYRENATDAASLIRVFSKSARPDVNPEDASWAKNAYPLDCDINVVPYLNQKFGMGKPAPQRKKKTGTNLRP